MAASEAIRDVLAEDEALAVLLTGGLYGYEQTGRSGMSRMTTPDAYDAGGSGFLKPCAVVKSGEVRGTAALRDAERGTRQRVEVYLYDDGDNGYGTIRQARDAVIAALDRRWVEGGGFVRWTGGADDGRDPKLNNAALVRVDFEVIK